MRLKNKTLFPDKRKGTVRVQKIGSDILFSWLDRRTNIIEESFVIPSKKGEAEFHQIPHKTNIRVFVLKIPKESIEFFLWMQEPNKEDDSEILNFAKFFFGDTSNEASLLEHNHVSEEHELPEEFEDYTSEGEFSESSECEKYIQSCVPPSESETEGYSEEETEPVVYDEEKSSDSDKLKRMREYEEIESMEEMSQPNKKRKIEKQTNSETDKSEADSNSILLERQDTAKVLGLKTKMREDCLQRIHDSIKENLRMCDAQLGEEDIQNLSIMVEYECFLNVLNSSKLKERYRKKVASTLGLINKKTKLGESCEIIFKHFKLSNS